ncbi:MAG: alpha/beta hydrolase, partial [Planctomycetia bacterium]
MLTTVATLSTDLSPYTKIPVTFRRPDGSVGFSNTAFVGQLGWSGMSGAAAAVGVPASFKSFCIDGLQFVSAGRATTFPTFSPAIAAAPLGGAPAIGVSRASLLESFWRQYGPASAAGFADKTDAAAFQLAVWEIINDATATGTRLTADLTSGQFSVGTAGRTLPAYQRAQQWLAGFDSTAPARSSVVLYALQSPTSQDQIVAVPTVDLDVDSDNTGAISRSAGEEGLEEQSGRPGVLVPVGGDRVPMVVEVPAGQAATLEIIKGADRVAVWTAAANGQRILSHQAPSNVITASTTLWVEGLTPSVGMADVAFRLSVSGGPGLAASSDIVHATTVAVDLSIDNLAIQIEDEGGAVIWKNSDFSRQLVAPMAFQSEPGLTRYLPDYTSTNTIDPEYRRQFTPAKATITAGMATGYNFQFSLQDSPSVTLWTMNPWEGFVPAEGGWWRIPVGKLVSPKSLADTTIDFWIEGLATTGYAEGSIGFSAVAKVGPLVVPSLVDTARYTVVDLGLGVDGNRDGTIHFSDSYDRQLTFWLNEDCDVLADPGLAGAVLYDRLGMPYETDDDTCSTTDADDERIATRRDLEDLAALHLVVDPVFQGTNSPFVRSFDRQQAPRRDRPLVRFDLTLGIPGTNLRLFRAAEDSATAHVDNAEIASLQRSNPRFAYNAEDFVVTGLSRGESAIVGDMVVYSQFDNDSRSQRPHFLFEAFGRPAKTILSFTVTVTYPRSSDDAEERSTSRTHTLDLDLRSVTSFYTRTQVPYREPDGTDERFVVVSPDGVMPHLPDVSSHRNMATTTQAPFLGGPETVVLVHGWNMTDGTETPGSRTDSKKAFAETSFKRLYWQGFRGSFISFEWPTFSGVDSYSASEYQAYRSGRALMHFLEARQAAGPTHLLAHSMGTVVAAEALRQWATDGRPGHLVANYVAMQGAIS